MAESLRDSIGDHEEPPGDVVISISRPCGRIEALGGVKEIATPFGLAMDSAYHQEEPPGDVVISPRYP